MGTARRLVGKRTRRGTPRKNKWIAGGAGEHPIHSSREWRDEVYREDTQLGYHDWVEHRLEAERVPEARGRGTAITADTIVYVAGAGWSESDTTMRCVATTAERAEECVTEQMHQEAEAAFDQEAYDSVPEALKSMAYYGIYTGKLSKVVSRSDELGRAIDALSSEGEYHPDW